MPYVFEVSFGEKGWDFVYGLCENEITNPEISDKHYTFIHSVMHNMICGRYWDYTRHTWTIDTDSGERKIVEDAAPHELIEFLEKYPRKSL